MGPPAAPGMLERWARRATATSHHIFCCRRNLHENPSLRKQSPPATPLPCLAHRRPLATHQCAGALLPNRPAWHSRSGAPNARIIDVRCLSAGDVYWRYPRISFSMSNGDTMARVFSTADLDFPRWQLHRKSRPFLLFALKGDRPAVGVDNALHHS